MSGDDGFLSRWAKRKTLASGGVEPPVDAAAPKTVEMQTPAPAQSPVPVEPAAGVAEPAPLPTMADVARLSRGSNFSSFVQPGVDPAVSNAAMRKLFSDPRYNVMDGLDTYIGDYNTPDPIPLAMLRQMNQSAVLRLFDQEVDAGPAAGGKPGEQTDVDALAGSRATVPATSPQPPLHDGTRVPAAPPSRSDDDTDL